MSAFIIARVLVRDPAKFQEYAQAAGPTIAAHGGQVIQRGKFAEALLGDAEAHSIGIMEFPDLSSIQAWFSSPDYQALTDLREQAADMELVAYEAPAA